MDTDAPPPGSSDRSPRAPGDRRRERPARGAAGRDRFGGPARWAGAGPSGTGPSGTGPLLELEGVVEQGVEAGAVVLRVEGGATWLVGADQRHLVGHRVRVRGAERLGVLTTAQQGPPLAVEAVEDLGPA